VAGAREYLLEAKVKLNYVNKILAERSFYEFVKQAWHTIDSTPFKDGWHIKAVCDHLQSVFDGETKRLIINIPPRLGKSLLVSVLYPAWVWVKKPEHRFLTGSHGKDLAIRDTRKSRQVLQSSWYNNRWGESFTLSSDQNQKSRYDNNYGGSRIAYSIGGMLTGEGGDTIMIDDPLDADDSLNANAITGVNDWYSSTLTTRLNSQDTGSIILIMQRLNVADLSGYLLDTNKFTHLCLPMEFDPDNRCKTFIFEDPRVEEGEILWDGISKAGLENLKLGLGPVNIPGQLQQRPVQKGGNIFKLSDMQYYKTSPGTYEYILQSWDTAFKAKQENDYSAMTTWGKIGNKIYLIDLWRGKVPFPELKNIFIQFAEKWKPTLAILEDKASGQSLFQELQREFKFPLLAIQPEGDKTSRANASTPYFATHMIYLPKEHEYVKDYVQELICFPNQLHDDWVDSTSQGVNYLAKVGVTPNFDIKKFNEFNKY
jgi:predicted phage terminase large subunit-like protein